MIDDFLNNKIWIHIRKEEFYLVDQLAELIPGLKYCSGDLVTTENLKKYHACDEVWFRHKNGVSFNRHYPPTSGCDSVSPWIYKYGEIVDIKDFLENRRLDVTEDEIIEMINGD